MNSWTKDQIFKELKTILVEALEIKPDMIRPESLIISDFGAESIDILDIAFRIERTFNIKIPEQAFSIDPSDIPKGKKASEILTVKLILDYIKKKLREKGPLQQNG